MAVPRVVGRADELGQLTALVRAGCHDGSQTVLVEGEAGIGKSTLVAAAAQTGGLDALVLAGSCLPLMAVTVPLLGLRSAVRSLPPERLPRFWAPASVAADRPSEPVPVLFDDWLTAESTRQPVILVVDDLQWADRETLDALMYVLAGPSDRPLCVLSTIRTGDVGTGHPLRRWLADARRLPRVSEMTLGPLSRERTAELLAGVLGSPPHTSLADQVHARSRGNPYLARLLVTGLDPGTRALPAGLPEQLTTAVARAWQTLSPDAMRLVSAIAVGGRPVTNATLARTSEIAGLEDPIPAVSEALESGLLEQNPAGPLWFRHPLQAEALEAEILPTERQAFHARFAAAYEAEAAALDTPPAELSQSISDHYALAGRDDEAYIWALSAADAMESDGDRTGALRMLRRAAALRPQLEHAPATVEDLLNRTRDMAERVGDWEAEIAAIDTLVPRLQEHDDDDSALEAAALLARRAILSNVSGLGETSTDLEQPLKVTARSPASWQRLYVLAEYLHILLWEDRTDDAATVAHEVGALLAEPPGLRSQPTQGWDRATAHAVAGLAMLRIAEGDHAAAHALGSRAADLAAEARDGTTMLDATFWSANSLVCPSIEWREEIRFRREQMQDLGIPHPYIAWLSASEAFAHFLVGDPDATADRLRVALGTDAGFGADFFARLTAAQLAAWQGRQSEAEAHLARAEELLRTDEASLPAFHHPTVKATVHLWGGAPALAVDAALSGMSREGANPASCEDLATLAARGLADLVQSCRDRGIDPEVHLERLGQLRRDFPQVLVDFAEITEDYQLELDAHNALYDAETARARASSDAQDRWVAAVELLGNTHLPWYESYACWRAADALLAGAPGRRERGQAAQMLRHGHGLASRLGCQSVQRSVEVLARAARVSLAPVDAQGGPTGGGGSLNQLTRREHEVLAHVVAGRTYAEIASALFLSEKTVSSHISNMLRKTGASNRIALASLANRDADA